MFSLVVPAGDRPYLEVHPLTRGVNGPTLQVRPKQYVDCWGKRHELVTFFVCYISLLANSMLLASPCCPRAKVDITNALRHSFPGKPNRPQSPPNRLPLPKVGAGWQRQGLVPSLSWSGSLATGLLCRPRPPCQYPKQSRRDPWGNNVPPKQCKYFPVQWCTWSSGVNVASFNLHPQVRINISEWPKRPGPVLGWTSSTKSSLNTSVGFHYALHTD